MQTCERCGAGLDDSVARCPYCGTETPNAPRLAAAAWQAQAYARTNTLTIADQQRRQASVDVSKSSMLAFVLSLLGLLVCCTPLSIWALVAALRARAAAKRAEIALPGSAVVAFVLFGLHVVCAGGFTIWFIHDASVRNARIAELQPIIDARAGAPELAQPVACALAEQRLLKEGFEGTGGISIADYSCDGRVIQNGDRAVLDSIRFHTSSTDVVSAKVCLSRGARWSVERITRGGCVAPAPSASAAHP